MLYSFEFAACHLVHGDNDFDEIVLDSQKVAKLTSIWFQLCQVR